MSKVYLGELDRFGYTLTCVGTTKKSVVNTIMEEYCTTYKHWNNGEDPKKEKGPYGDGKSCYASAKEDICVWDLELDKTVEWR